MHLKRIIGMAAALALLVVLVGCSNKPEQTVRDGIAAMNGYISAAQAQHPECSPANHPENQGKAQCQVIARGIGANNLAIDGLEVYCSGPGFNAGTGPCEAPKKGTPGYQTAVAKLSAATAGLPQAQKDIKQLLGVK